jgi:hypothetical protein
VNTVLSIGQEHQDSDRLLLEAGPGYFSYGWVDEGRTAFRHLRYCTFDEFEEQASWRALLDELNDYRFSSVDVCLATPYAVVAPLSFQGDPQQLLRAVYDLPGQRFYTDDVPEWQMSVLYMQPTALEPMLLSRFPQARFRHLFTANLKVYNGVSSTDQIELAFSPKHFQVIVKRSGALQLAQIYAYKTPLDVVYYLLKICYELGLDQQSVTLVVSGMVDRNSPMFTELHAYFLDLQFAPAPQLALPDNEHPHYYFSSLYKLAQCAS